MPNITLPNLNMPKLTPSNAGPAAYAAIAQAKEKTGADLDADFTKIGATVGNFVQQHQAAQSQKELSTGATSYATGIYSQTEAWNATTSDPKFDPSTGQEMGQQAIDANNKFWDDWASKFTTSQGKAFAAEHATTAKLDFEKTVNADQGKFAADTAVTNTNTTVNTLVEHVNADPSQLDTVLAQLPGLIQAHIPQGIPYADRAKLTTEGIQTASKALAFAGLSKMARANPGITNPDGTPATSGFMVDVNSGKLDADMALLDPAQQTAVVGYATAADKADQRTRTTLSVAQAKQQRDAVDGTVTKLYSGLHNPDGSVNSAGVAAAQQALINVLPGLPGVKPTDMSNLQIQIDKAQSGADKLDKDDPTVRTSLEAGIESGQTTVPMIWQAAGQGHLSVGTRDTLLGEQKAYHPVDKPGPLDNAVDKQAYDANLNLLEPSLSGNALISKYMDKNGKALTGAALNVDLAARNAYQDWYRRSFMAGIALNYSPTDMLYSNGAHYIDPQSYKGPDPEGLLRSAASVSSQPAFSFGNSSSPAPTGSFSPAPAAAPVVKPSTPALPRDSKGVLLPTLPQFGGKP